MCIENGRGGGMATKREMEHKASAAINDGGSNNLAMTVDCRLWWSSSNYMKYEWNTVPNRFIIQGCDPKIVYHKA